MIVAPDKALNGMTRQQLVAHVRCLEIRINELEATIDKSVFVEDAEIRCIKSSLGLSRGEAAVIVALSQTEGYLTLAELEAIVPQDFSNAARKDPEFRTVGVINQFVGRIRKKAPYMLIPNPTRQRGGVSLTVEGRRLVLNLLRRPVMRSVKVKEL